MGFCCFTMCMEKEHPICMYEARTFTYHSKYAYILMQMEAPIASTDGVTNKHLPVQ